jgi:hypothetical protein
MRAFFDQVYVSPIGPDPAGILRRCVSTGVQNCNDRIKSMLPFPKPGDS